MRCVAERAAPTNIGTSKAPAGILDFHPNGSHRRRPRPPSRGAGQGASKGETRRSTAAAAAPGWQPIVAQRARRPARRRRPADTASRRRAVPSPPKASDISTIAVAAPAEEPQTAVVSREHSHAREDITEDRGEEDEHRADQDKEHRPPAEERHYDIGGDRARDKASNETLSNQQSSRPESSRALRTTHRAIAAAIG